jgi:hypothetical protein
MEYKEEYRAFVEPKVHKQLDSGQILLHYRISTKYVIVEKVFYGFKKKFLDGLEIFTIDGCLISKLYRIRNVEYSATSSKDLVEKHLFDFMYCQENRKLLPNFIKLFYEPSNENVQIFKTFADINPPNNGLKLFIERIKNQT